MSIIDPTHHVRIARPTRDLVAAQQFWCDGLGLEVLWHTDSTAQGGHALLMLGQPTAPWHLELVHDAEALDANPPGPEDLLVIYRGRALAPAELHHLETRGGQRVSPRNPYWGEHGTTLRDPDGYHLVLSHRTWG